MREWLRKNESKISLEQLGNDSPGSKKTTAIYNVEMEDDQTENHDEDFNEEQYEINTLRARPLGTSSELCG